MFLLAITVLAACRRAEEPAPLPDDLRIDVEIAGSPAPPIDAARLRAAKPDYVDEHRRAWKLSSLLGPTYVVARTQLEVDQADGTRTVFTRPSDAAEGIEPVIIVNRQGEALLALVNTAEPFPAFHGRGGNRGRPGGGERLRNVTRLRLSAQP